MITRYLINGVFATLVHYSVLYFLVEIATLESIGFANLLASVFGIGSSFLGNKYYVFSAGLSPVKRQLLLFVAFYGLLALTHGLVLYLWSDMLGLHYSYGFLIALAIQVVLGFFVNKYVVFKNDVATRKPSF